MRLCIVPRGLSSTHLIARSQRRESERSGGVDMLGQSNMMATFEQGGDDDDDQFMFDEYGAGGF